MAAPAYLLISSVWGFSLFHTLANTCYCLSFRCCLTLVRMSVSLWFWLAFPWLVMLTTFSWTCWPFVCCPWENVYSDPLPTFLNHIFFFWVLWVLLIFWILLLSWIYHLQIFSPIQDLTFLCTWWFPLLCSNVIVHYNLFFFGFWCQIQKSHHQGTRLYLRSLWFVLLFFNLNII